MRYFFGNLHGQNTCFVNVADEPAMGYWKVRKSSIYDKE